MKILAIDSSGLTATVAVLEDDRLTAEYTINYKKTHSQTLLPMLAQLKESIELDLNTLDAIAISNGPGSFTGLRIGCASAKGLGLALDIPLIQVPTVKALAYNLFGSSELVCPIMDARRGEVYTGIYSFVKTSGGVFEYECETVMDNVPMPVLQLIDRINELQKPVIFNGDGVAVYKDIICENIKVDCSFAAPAFLYQKASSVATLGMEMFAKGETVTAAESSPIYLRLSQAERERAGINGI